MRDVCGLTHSFEQGSGSYPSTLKHRQSWILSSCALLSTEVDQAVLLSARDFEHFALKKENENLHKQEVSSEADKKTGHRANLK